MNEVATSSLNANMLTETTPFACVKGVALRLCHNYLIQESLPVVTAVTGHLEPAYK